MNSKGLYQILSIGLLFFAVSCGKKEQLQWEDYYKTEFFKEVQLTGIFEDSKTFVDCIAKRPLSKILSDYQNRKLEGFDLKSFVLANFEVPVSTGNDFESDTSKSMSEHINSLWPVLTKKPDKQNSKSSLIPLPNSYIVQRGRFREVYYWDSYFTLLGLVQSDIDLATKMVDNFSFLIDSIGFVPNGNRDYYTSRSQPPFFSLMVSLVASEDRDQFVGYLNSMLKEYNFWMKGANLLTTANTNELRVVMLPDSSILNRFWDDNDRPRPESYKEDYELVMHSDLEESAVYRHLRAGAESGWDYTSRWFGDKENIETIHTTDIIPVDLNSLMYHLELMIAQGYSWSGNIKKAKEFLELAEKRKKAILKYLWDDEAGFFVDFDHTKDQPTGVLSLAGAYPLFFSLATKAQANLMVPKITNDFLVGGGFVTTLNHTGHQWDYPNGWAPLQWITVNGLYNYGEYDLGNEGAQRWLKRNRQVYKATGWMMEKYNVVDTDLLVDGGEYPLQDGFGWTNGVALALEKILHEKAKAEKIFSTP